MEKARVAGRPKGQESRRQKASSHDHHAKIIFALAAWREAGPEGLKGEGKRQRRTITARLAAS